MNVPCPHLNVIDRNLSSDLINEKKGIPCEWCGAEGQSHWLCLYTGCLRVGCGETHADHSTRHNNQLPSHCITLNLTTLRAWCYMCENEVTSSVMAKLTVHPSQEQHLGGFICAPGVSVATPASPADSSGEEEEDEDGEEEEIKPRGLVGLRNLGYTCYMNAALQALSNSMPLSHFMLDCPAFLRSDRRQHGIYRAYHRLVADLWHKKRPSFVTPSALYQGFRQMYPTFRAYTQQDSQEFLRYFMDQLHEELREPKVTTHEEDENNAMEEEEEDLSSVGSISERDESQSEAEYETCDSGVSEQSSLSGASDHHYCNKRKKRRHLHSTENLHGSWSGLTSCSTSEGHPEQDVGEFSDALSDTNLIDQQHGGSSAPLTGRSVSLTSGLGSSKPSTLSLSASVRGSSGKRKKAVQYRSIISDIFDGFILSSVQCLTCNTVSSRKETFQDLSLPIPSGDQLNLLQLAQQGSNNLHVIKASCDGGRDGWMWWMWSWVRSWFWGPSVSLHHCLAAFFSADELKGDNMYSCEKCGKLRNGIKYSKVVQLPEMLIIHLKRFRHEYMYSAKISQYVSFPLQGLDLTPFLHKDCHSEVRMYDLYAVICHHGTAGGGHYTTFAQNWTNRRWYEFDDQYVTEVSPETVANCEAYVLFYKKSSPEMAARRQRTIELMQVAEREQSLMQFYVSKQWINKFNTFSEPGPIDNSDFLCPHGGVQPQKASYVGELVMLLNQGVWEYLHQAFGGGPACTRLYECVTCRAELEALYQRQRDELETFIKLRGLFQEEEQTNIVYVISMRWFRQWEAFVRGREQESPGPIDNSVICHSKAGQAVLKPDSDHAQISEDIWQFFHGIYGGGPEICFRYGNPPSVVRHSSRTEESHHTETFTHGARSLSTDSLPHQHIAPTHGPSTSTAATSTTTSRQRTASAGEVPINQASPRTRGKVHSRNMDSHCIAANSPSTSSAMTHKMDTQDVEEKNEVEEEEMRSEEVVEETKTKPDRGEHCSGDFYMNGENVEEEN
ncbi:ubiquitin carboxyl-terminal hydrolase 20-like isoform X2 [Oratosquilla oratoria]